MRLPQPQLESVCFLFDGAADLIQALGAECSAVEAEEIRRLCGAGLPPITSINALSTMLGYNPGFVWSLVHRTAKHYRKFEIPKGKGQRKIQAPRVALKAIQKWLSFHFQRLWVPFDCVYGFVPGRSHVEAASRHVLSEWIYSVDIEDFFPSTSALRVRAAVEEIGYRTDDSLSIITRLLCYNGFLAQGAPTSPVISNIALSALDPILSEVAIANNFTYTRYADDMVFSGKGDLLPEIKASIKRFVEGDGWKLSERKEEFSRLPMRLKVHGLLVHGSTVRLTKGYRNRIRAYKHLVDAGKIKDCDIHKISGHLNYASFVEKDKGEKG